MPLFWDNTTSTDVPRRTCGKTPRCGEGSAEKTKENDWDCDKDTAAPVPLG